MKCQILFSGKNEKKYIKMASAEIFMLIRGQDTDLHIVISLDIGIDMSSPNSVDANQTV